MFIEIMIFAHSLMDENDPIGLLFCMMFFDKVVNFFFILFCGILLKIFIHSCYRDLERDLSLSEDSDDETSKVIISLNY